MSTAEVDMWHYIKKKKKKKKKKKNRGCSATPLARFGVAELPRPPHSRKIYIYIYNIYMKPSIFFDGFWPMATPIGKSSNFFDGFWPLGVATP
jgi:hypothetical protein